MNKNSIYSVVAIVFLFVAVGAVAIYAGAQGYFKIKADESVPSYFTAEVLNSPGIPLKMGANFLTNGETNLTLEDKVVKLKSGTISLKQAIGARIISAVYVGSEKKSLGRDVSIIAPNENFELGVDDISDSPSIISEGIR